MHRHNAIPSFRKSQKQPCPGRKREQRWVPRQKGDKGLKAVEDLVSDFNRVYPSTYWSELLERLTDRQGTLPNNENVWHWPWPPHESLLCGKVRHSTLVKSEFLVTCIKLGSGYPWKKKWLNESPRKSQKPDGNGFSNKQLEKITSFTGLQP